MMYKGYTNEEINNAWKVLAAVGSPELTFQVWGKPEEENTIRTLDRIVSLIRSMGSFNDKDADAIAFSFNNFFNSLPTSYYQEGNPNNGSYFFDRVTFHGDDYIIIEANALAQYGIDEAPVEELVNKYGELWKADVHTLTVEHNGFGSISYTIKFWWD